MDKLFLNEYRCVCGKLLLKGVFLDANVEIKCKKCGVINSIGSLKLAGDLTHYLLIINDKGIIKNCNDSACKILGYTYDELIGKLFIEVNPNFISVFGKKFFGQESVLNEENYFKLDSFHETKDGRKIPVTVLLKLYQPSKEETFVLLSVELKDTMSVESIESKDISQYENSGCDFYFDIDKNGFGQYISPSVTALFGFSPETMIGKDFFDYLPLATRARNKTTFDHYSMLRQPFRASLVSGLDTAGRPIQTELYFTPNFNDNGNFVGYHISGWVIKKQ